MSALDAQLGIGIESTFGTIATPTRFLEFSSEGIEPSYGRIESGGLKPGRLYRSDTRWTPYIEGAAGDLEMEVVSKGMGFLFTHMLGATTVGPLTDGTYKQTSVPGSLTGKSLTAQVYRPFFDGANGQAFTYPGGKVTSWELSNSAEENLMLKLSMDFLTQDTATAKAVASYPSGIETFSWVGGLVTVAGTQFDVTEASVSGDNSLKTDRRYIRRNTLKKEQIGNDYRSGEFSLAADFEDLAQLNRVASQTAAGAMAQIVLSWRGVTLAGAATYPSVTVTINARLDKWAATVGGAESVSQQIDGMYLGQSAISIEYVSTDTAP